MAASFLWYLLLQVYHETSTSKFEWKFPVVIFAVLYKIWGSMKWCTSPPTYPWGKGGWGGGGRGGSSLKGATFLSYKTSFKLNLLGGLISFPGQLFCRNAALLVPSLSPLSLKIKYYWGKCVEDATGERWAAPFPWYCFHIVLQKMLKSIFKKKLFRVTAYWLRGRAFNS